MHDQARAPVLDAAALAERARAALERDPPDLDDGIGLALMALGRGGGDLAWIPARVLEAIRHAGEGSRVVAALERELDPIAVGLEHARHIGAPLPPAGLGADERAAAASDPLAAARLVDQVHWLRQAAALAEGRGGDLLSHQAVRTLAWLHAEVERGAAAAAGTPAHDEARARLRDARRALARGRVARHAGTLAALADDPSLPLDQAWHEVATAAEHLADARAVLGEARERPNGEAPPDDDEPESAPRDDGLADAVAAVLALRARLFDHLAARLGALAADSRVAHLAAWAEDLAEGATNALGLAEDQAIGTALGGLDLKRAAAEWLAARIDEALADDALGQDARKRLAAARRLVRGTMGQLVRETDELSVRRGLTGAFGARAVGRLEKGVLVLIALVLVLFGVEAALHDVLAARGLLLWFDLADALLCVAFLAELALRVRFAPDRRRYLRRHALTDLLPALPFGMLAHGLEALSHAAGATAGATAVNDARLARAIWLLRLPRIARYLRVLRPLIRALRLFVFFQRGLDHVVRRARPLLDREVVLFAPPRTAVEWPPSLELRYGEIARAAERALRTSVRALEPEPRLRRVAALAAHQQERFEALGPPVPELDPILLADAEGDLADDDGEDPVDEREPQAAGLGPAPPLGLAPSPVAGAAASALHALPASRSARARRAGLRPPIRLDELIQDLGRADAALVEEALGRPLADRLGRLILLHDLPIVRALGPLRRVLARSPATGAPPEPVEVVARASRELGLYLERGLALVRYFADLRGIVTGPQLVDRVGTTVIKATEKPAKRLLIFGGIFVAVYLLFKGLGLVALSGMFRWLNKVLVTPVIVIGAIALVLMHLGRWFKRVAGEATDVYARVAEAQFYNLLVYEKLRYLEEDLGLIWRRVVRPEADPRHVLGQGEDAAVAALREEALRAPVAAPAGLPARAGADRATSLDDSVDRVLLLYRDYLTGAPLHPSDTKTPLQLLGNLTVRSIIAERLRLSAREQRDLNKVDLERSSGVGGPFLWFHFITLALTEQTAKLLMEYNRYCQPRLEAASSQGDEPRETRAWIERRKRGPAGESADERREQERERQALDHYASTAFDALHFLCVDPSRDERVRVRFGDEVLALLRRDRQALARTVFGSSPLHRLPREQRVVNPFRLYKAYVARGRILLLPLRLIRIGARAARLGLGKLAQTFRDVIGRNFSADPLEVEPDPQAAIRKIHRMRRPVYMAALDLRARFDPEYAGVLAPDAPEGAESTTTLFDDLDAIEANATERERYRAMRRRYEDLRAAFVRLMHEEPAAFRVRPPERVRGLAGAPMEHESLRAAWVAYAIDYAGVRTLLEAPEAVESVLARAIASGGAWPPASRVRRARTGLGRAIATRRGRREDAVERAFRIYWEARPDAATAPALHREAARRAYLLDAEGVRAKVRLVSERGGPGLARRAGLTTLGGIMRNPTGWTRQLVVLRTVQTLAALDVRNYRDLVLRLGFEGDGVGDSGGGGVDGAAASAGPAAAAIPLAT